MKSLLLLALLLPASCDLSGAAMRGLDSPRNFTALDGITQQLQACTSDTCRYYIFEEQSSKYYTKDSIRYKYYIERAIQELSNTKHPKFIGKLNLKMGIMARINGLPDSTLYYCKKALEYAELTNDKRTIAVACRNLSWDAQVKGNISKAIHYLKKAETCSFQLNWLFYTHNFVQEISFHYTNMGQLDSAIVYINNSIAKHKALGLDEYVIQYYVMLAGVYQRQSKPKQALACYYEALTFADSTKDNTLIAQAYTYIGEFLLNGKDANPVALEYFQKAIELSTSTDSAFIARNNNAMGNFYLHINEKTMAREYFWKAIDVSPLHHCENFFLSVYYRDLALSYQKEAMYDSAIYYHHYALRVNPNVCRYVFEELGDCYFNIGKHSEALEYYQQALDLFTPIDDKTRLSMIHKRLGDYYTETHQHPYAEDHYSRAYSEARELNDLSLLIRTSEALRKFYLSQHKYQLAHKYAAIHLVVADSLKKMDKHTNMAAFETKFAFDALKENHRVAAEQAKRERLYRNSALLISFLLVCIGILLFLGYKRKKRDYHLLNQQKKEIENKVEEIISQRDEIERVSQQLHESDQQKIRFFTNLSHELRTPLTLLISPLERVCSRLTDASDRAFVSTMLQNATKLKKLINQQLDISRIDNSELALNKEFLDFNQLFRLSTAMFSSLAQDKGIKLMVTSSVKNELKFSFDKERMEQVLNNLLSNAFKFTAEGGEILATLGTHNNSLLLSIRDTGIGIPNPDLSRIFHRFYQSSESIVNNYEGTGLGLSIVKEYVELHQGSISVQSELGKGSEFMVRLPLLISEVKKDTQVGIDSEIEYTPDTPSVNQAKVGKPAKNNPVLLVVEDNKDLKNYLTILFQNQYKVLEASNGEIAKTLAARDNPDLILSDVMMPICNGYQLCEWIKSQLETSHIPVILLTAKAHQNDKLTGYQQGADDYIAKPFDEKELLLKVMNILHTQNQHREKYRRSITVNPSEVTANSLDEQFIIDVTQVVEANISNSDLTVDQLCAESGVSRRNLFRKLKAITGLTPNQFIRSIRLKRAAQLLAQQSGSVSEIAFECGFENLSYFTKRFKETFNALPSEFA